jgi:hypothetical protein
MAASASCYHHLVASQIVECSGFLQNYTLAGSRQPTIYIIIGGVTSWELQGDGLQHMLPMASQIILDWRNPKEYIKK